MFETLYAMLSGFTDRVQVPEVMLPYYEHKMEQDNRTIMLETANALSLAKNSQRKIDALNRDIENMEKYARMAVKANNDDDARKFLMQKEKLEATKFEHEKYNAEHWTNVARLMVISDKAQRDLKDIKERTELLLSEKSVAEAQNKVVGIETRMNSGAGYKAGYEKNAQKVYHYIDNADAKYALLEAKNRNDVNELAYTYERNLCDENVETNLAALKYEIHGAPGIAENNAPDESNQVGA